MRSKMFAGAFLCVVLAACGGGGSSAPQEPDRSNLSITVGPLPQSTPAGSTVTLTVTVANSGPATATGVGVLADVAQGVEVAALFKCRDFGGARCPTPSATGFADMPVGGSLQLDFSALVSSGAHGPLTSTLVAVANNDTTDASNRALAVLNVYQADVSVTGSGPNGSVSLGQTATYQMTVSNAGPDDALNVQLTDTLGDGQSLGLILCAPDGGAACPANLGLSMTVPVLPAHATLTFVVNAHVTFDTSVIVSLTNTLSAASAGDPDPTNNKFTTTPPSL